AMERSSTLTVRTGGVVASFAAAVLLAAAAQAGGSKSVAGAGSQPPGRFQITLPKGYKGNLAPSERKLWVYDHKTGLFKVVPGDASKGYVYSDDQTVPAGTVLAFGDGQASIPFSA